MSMSAGEQEILVSQKNLELFVYAVIKASGLPNEKMLVELSKLADTIPKSELDQRRDFNRLQNLFCTKGTPFVD
jgi:hypothetical protein